MGDGVGTGVLAVRPAPQSGQTVSKVPPVAVRSIAMTCAFIRRYNPARMSYWDIVEPYWEVINIYDGPEVFLQSYGSAPKTSRLLFAAHFATSEICNGGFHQFFHNSTGVLAPEAAEAFRGIGQAEVASLIESAMARFGVPYPRDREQRVELL